MLRTIINDLTLMNAKKFKMKVNETADLRMRTKDRRNINVKNNH